MSKINKYFINNENLLAEKEKYKNQYFWVNFLILILSPFIFINFFNLIIINFDIVTSAIIMAFFILPLPIIHNIYIARRLKNKKISYVFTSKSEFITKYITTMLVQIILIVLFLTNIYYVNSEFFENFNYILLFSIIGILILAFSTYVRLYFYSNLYKVNNG